MKTSESNLLRTTLFDSAIVGSEKNSNILPVLLDSYKQFFALLFSQKNILFKETLDI